MSSFHVEEAVIAIETLLLRNGNNIFFPPRSLRDGKDSLAWFWFTTKLQADLAHAVFFIGAEELNRGDIIEMFEDMLQENVSRAIELYEERDRVVGEGNHIIKVIGKYWKVDNGEHFIEQSVARFMNFFDNEIRIANGISGRS